MAIIGNPNVRYNMTKTFAINRTRAMFKLNLIEMVVKQFFMLSKFYTPVNIFAVANNCQNISIYPYYYSKYYPKKSMSAK